MDQPKWLEAAWSALGEREIAGAADNPAILRFFADVGCAAGVHDETAWCAAFVGSCMERAGLVSTRSLRARSYLDWGAALSSPRLGAVAVLNRGSNPALGHVGFVIGQTGDSIVLLGGNQSDSVTVAAFESERLIDCRWPEIADQQEAFASDHTLFDSALAHVLEMEGGFSDDPYDPGGPTNFGITLKVFATWQGLKLDAASQAALKADLVRITPETVRSIYRAWYWLPARCADLPPPLAFMHFDAAVNHGVTGAARFLQTAVGADVDGEIGPLTLAAVAGCDVPAALYAYADLRRTRYRSLPHFWRFGRGWLARVDKTLARALAVVAAPPAHSQSSSQKGSIPMENELPEPSGAETSKWWGNSVTIWGALISGLSVVLPALGPVLGLDLTTDLVQQLGEQVATAFQALAALFGTLMAIYGRVRARQPIERRIVNLKL
jgi:uncharacterized protein (TIGR02594 family)